MKRISTHLKPLLYAMVAALSVILYVSCGFLNGDFLYGFECFSMRTDEPQPAELPDMETISLIALSLFAGSYIAWRISKPETWKRYLHCALLSVPFCFLVMYILFIPFAIIEMGFSGTNMLTAIYACSIFSIFGTVQCIGLFILPVLCSCLQSAMILKMEMWRKSKRLLIFIPFIFLYLVGINKGISVIDPCSATPGYNDAAGVILLMFFPFIAGVLLHRYLRDYSFSKLRRYWIAGLSPSVFLILSFFLATSLLFHLEAGLRNTKLWNFIYHADCYNDAEPEPLILFAVVSVIFYVFLLLLFIAFRRFTIHEKTNMH